MDDIGIIYAVRGEKYLSEVYDSIKSVRSTNPEIPITIFSDINPENILQSEHNIDHIDISDARFSKRPKIDCLLQTPYKKTLYLDSDTYVQGDLKNIFEFLDGYDFVCKCQEQNYEWSHKSSEDKEFPGGISNEEEFRERLDMNTPRMMPDYNSAVVAYNMNERTRELLNTWGSIYEKHLEIPGYFRDQPALRKAIFETDVKVGGSLPPECNFSIRKLYGSRGLNRKIRQRPLIMHGRSHNKEKAIENINKRVESRGYIIKHKSIIDEIFEKGWILSKSIYYNGWGPTFSKLKSFIKRKIR